MEFRILGPLEVCEGGRSLPLGGAKQRAFLAVLLVHANQVISADRLIDELWGEQPPRAAANVVQTYVSRLRKVLHGPAAGAGDVLLSRPPGYVLQVGPGELDVYVFENRIREARSGLGADPGEASRLLMEAFDLWRGPVLADFAYEAFAQAEIGRLEELRAAAIEDRVEADLALGRHAALAGELDALVSAYPLRERLRGQRILALYRSGRQAEALQAYAETRRVLAEEFGIDPSPALQRLESAILTQDPGLDLAPRAIAAAGEPAEAGRAGLQVQAPARAEAGAAQALASRARRAVASRGSGPGDGSVDVPHPQAPDPAGPPAGRTGSLRVPSCLDPRCCLRALAHAPARGPA
jgi:DNA-binding SARP family transcriptional activator